MSFSRNYYVPRAPLFSDNGLRRTHLASPDGGKSSGGGKRPEVMIFEAYVWDAQILNVISGPAFVIPFEIQQIRTSKSVLNAILEMKRQKEQLQRERQEREEKERQRLALQTMPSMLPIETVPEEDTSTLPPPPPSAPFVGGSTRHQVDDAYTADDEYEQPEEEKLSVEQQLLVKLASDHSLCASRRELQKSDNTSMGLYHDDKVRARCAHSRHEAPECT
jgi:hypothetical protein